MNFTVLSSFIRQLCVRSWVRVYVCEDLSTCIYIDWLGNYITSFNEVVIKVVFRVKFVCPTNTLTYNRFNVFLIVWLMNIFLCRDQEKGMDPNTLILKSGLLLNNYSKRFTQIWTVLSLYLIRSATIFRKRFWLNHNSVSNFRIYIDERWLSG